MNVKSVNQVIIWKKAHVIQRRYIVRIKDMKRAIRVRIGKKSRLVRYLEERRIIISARIKR